MNSAEVLIKFKGDTTDAEKKTSNMTSSINGLAKSFTAGALAAQAVTKAIQVFSSNLDSAISRVDTMNNFPKVMSNLGISAEDSAEVIEDLGKQLQGLPTSLDSAAMAVQRFTSKNSDVKESEKIFLAVNNAILAGGAPAQNQAAALEQISQAYAKGKPDMMEWRTIMTAMPAQMKQVATAMGYISPDELGAALREGTVTMDEFMQTMMKANTEGVAGFKSFDEQARNATGGISTSVVNMKTAITRGIANMLNSINKALEPFGGISGVLAKVGKAGEQAFTAIGNAVSKAVPYLINFGKWIKNNEAWLKPLVIMIGTFIATFKTIKTIITIINGVKTAMIALKVAIAAAGGPITLIIAGVAALVAGFIYLWNKCDAFRQFWINMWNGFKKVVSTVVNFVKKNWKTMLLAIVNPFAAVFKLLYDNCEGFRNVVNNVVTAIKNFFANAGQWFYDTVISPIMNVVNGILDFVRNVGILLIALVTIPIDFIVKKILLPVASFIWDNVLSPVIEFFRNAFNTIKGVVETVIDKVKSVIHAIVDFISTNVLNPVINTFTTVFDKIWSVVSKVIDKIKNAFTNIKNFIKGVWDTVSGAAETAFNAVKDTISNVFQTIGNVIKAPINGIIDGINKVLKSINKLKIPDWVPEIGGSHTNFSMIPKLNVGTNYVPEDTLAMIHEGEAVIPKKFNPYANPVNSSTLGTMNGSSTTTIINVQVNQKQDPLGRLVQDVKTFSGGAKQDYLYGR